MLQGFILYTIYFTSYMYTESLPHLVYLSTFLEAATTSTPFTHQVLGMLSSTI